MARRLNQRKRILIDLPVQGGIALRLVVFWTATSIFAALVAVVLQFFADPAQGFLAHLTEPMNWAPSLIAFLVTMPIACLDLTRYLHKFVGPVHRLRTEMRRLAEGEAPRSIEFRKGDYWRDLADTFNDVGERIERLEEAEAHDDEAVACSGAAL